MPAAWGNIRVGMTSADAVVHLPDGYNNLRELKGFDSSMHSTTMMGQPAEWKLLVFYDAAGRVRTAEASFSHQRYLGIFNVRKTIP